MQQQAFEYGTVSFQKRISPEGKALVQPLGFVNFNKVIFRPIELLKLIGSWFSERAAKIYSVLSRVNQQSPLQ